MTIPKGILKNSGYLDHRSLPRHVNFESLEDEEVEEDLKPTDSLTESDASDEKVN